MSLQLWLSLLAICCLGAMSPGPSLAVVLRHTLQHSKQHGMVVGISHALGVGIYASLSVTGLAGLFVFYPGLQQALAYMGAAYLVWLAYGALRSSGYRLDAGAKTSISLSAAARDGFAIALLNPKLMLFFVALFSQFVDPDYAWYWSALLVATATVVDGLWYCLVASFLSRPQWIDRLQAKAILIDRLTGIILLLLALRVVTL